MSLTHADVEKVALLARLQLTQAELESMTEKLGQVLGYIDLLSEVETDHIEPLAHPTDISNVFRADEVKPSLTREAALSNAPKHDDKGYQVPAVLGV